MFTLFSEGSSLFGVFPPFGMQAPAYTYFFLISLKRHHRRFRSRGSGRGRLTVCCPPYPKRCTIGKRVHCCVKFPFPENGVGCGG